LLIFQPMRSMRSFNTFNTFKAFKHFGNGTFSAAYFCNLHAWIGIETHFYTGSLSLESSRGPKKGWSLFNL
jgi:hypothetical protein